MSTRNSHIIKILPVALSLLLFFSKTNFANTSATEDSLKQHTEGSHHKKKFEPSSFIIDHIMDSYEWHIMTINEKHVSIPLPVILYSNTEQNKGLHVFMSSEFHHGHEKHENFMIAHSGDNKGKIVEILPDGSTVRPLDVSITKDVAAIFISIILIIWIFTSIAKRYKENPYRSPKGLQSLLEPVILFIRDDVAKPSIGEEYKRYMPYLLTVFFFIFFNNLAGLIPIFPFGANITGNISVTLVLALFTFFLTSFTGNKHYWQHIFNTPGVPWWLKFPVPLMPIIEIIGAITKPFVLMVRLFANIAAGHIVMLGFFSLIFIFGGMSLFAGYGVSVFSVLFSVFISFLELLVAFIQAYVFTLLSALYFGMAREGRH